MRGIRSVGAGIAALALVVSACGPSPKEKAEAQKAALLEEATAACDVCDAKALQPLSGQIKQKLVEAAGAVSPEGAKILAENQKAWAEAQRVACGVAKEAETLTPVQEACLKGALSDRVKSAAGAVEKIGGYTFQRVEINDAQPVTAEAAGAMSFGPDAPIAVTRSIEYPRIDGDSPEVKKFNAAVAQSPRFKLEDQTEETTTYKIVYAGPELISVRFDTYDYTIGAAHPNTGMKAITVLMKTGAELKASDVFKPDSGWQDALARFAIKDLDAQIREQDDTAPPLAATDVRDAAIKPEHWLVSDKALVILFPAYSVGPYAIGAFEVSVPWSALKPYLDPAAPRPIGG